MTEVAIAVPEDGLGVRSPVAALHAARTWLAPPITADQDPRHRGRKPRMRALRWALTMVVFAAGVGLPLLRYRGRPAWETVWGEDGHVFYQQALAGGSAQFTTGFSGYLSLPPRLLSFPAARMPIEWLSAYDAIAGALVTALLAAFVFRSARAWVASPAVRLALAALVVLMPAAGGENTAVLVNTIWAFAAALPWAIISEEDRPSDVVLRSAVAFLAATSTGLSFVFLPLVLAWVVLRRNRAVVTVVSAFLVGLVIQAIVTVQSSEPPPAVPVGHAAGDMVNLFGARVFAVYLFGVEGATTLWDAYGRLALLGSTILLCAIVVVVWRGAGRRAQVAGWMFLVYALLTFLVPVWGRGTTAFGLGGKEIAIFQHIRYSVVPTLMVGSGLAVLLSPAGAAGASRRRRLGRPLFVAHVAVVIVAGFTITGYRSEGPTWRERVVTARTECAAKPRGATVTIPQDKLHFWQVRVPCSHLDP